VREETRTTPTCAICQKPITQDQRPSILMRPGVEVHFECWHREQREKEKKPEAE
jgi:hypothetical protein